ncbi:MAG: hypothetical protein ACFFAB_15975 [Candidatus Heimdallarchaeota archaeon]
MTLGFVITPATAHTEESPFITDLIAGGGNPESAIDVGDVIVWNDGEFLYVKYQTIDDWYLVETHLAVETIFEEIPQTEPNKQGKGGGNPIPGHFEWKREYCPPEQSDLFVIDLDGWNIDTILYIAAHAEVIHIASSCEIIVSDSNVVWEDLSHIWLPAVPCWTHGSWPSITGANWIWRTEFTDPAWEYLNVPQYSVLPDEFGWLFKKEFILPDTAHNIIGEMNITADNSYKLWVNEIDIGGDGTMHKDGPDSHEWNSIETYDISDELNSGENDISIRALNYFSSGSSSSNPAGLLFKACICYDYIDMEETAWGAGIDFPGSNWATYFTYTVQGETYDIWPEGGTISIAYEDMPIDGGNDWDYNDFVVDIDVLAVFFGTSIDRDLIQINFTIHPEVKLAGYHHMMHLDADTFTGDGNYELYRDGSLIISDIYDHNVGIDVVLVPDTNMLPTEVILSITFDEGCEFEFPEWDQNLYHGENLFYDPYLHVINTGQDIRRGDSRMLTVPTDWSWPFPDGTRIWTVYPKVTEGNPPTFIPYWWTP